MEIKVLTLNVWGLRNGLAVRVTERLQHIVRELPKYDIVSLQEVWNKTDFQWIADQLRTTLSHSHYFHSGVIGSGLCIFSRFPIVTGFSHEFSVSGGIRQIKYGETFAGKGCMACLIRTPLGVLAVFNTHVNPQCRHSQLFELMQFISAIRSHYPVISCGDYNTMPKHLPYKLVTECLGLSDVYADDPVDTVDKRDNIYTKKTMTPKRIDFLLYSDELSSRLTLKLQGRKLALTGIIPGKDFPYSDHDGVEGVFVIHERPEKEVLTVLGKERMMTDQALQTLEGVRDCIRQKVANLRSTYRSHHCTVCVWATLLAVTIIATILLSSVSLNQFLAGYGLWWVSSLVLALVAAGAISVVCLTVSDWRTINGLEENLSELATLIKYHRSLQMDVHTSVILSNHMTKIP